MASASKLETARARISYDTLALIPYASYWYTTGRIGVKHSRLMMLLPWDESQSCTQTQDNSRKQYVEEQGSTVQTWQGRSLTTGEPILRVVTAEQPPVRI